jgi:hypothetical protein
LLLLATLRKTALLGSSFILVYVQSYGYSFSIETEALFGFLLMLALFFLVKYLVSEKKSAWLFFAFAVTLNFALLTRPILLYFNLLLCPALLVLAFLKKTSVKCAALFVLCFAAAFGGGRSGITRIRQSLSIPPSTTTMWPTCKCRWWRRT